MHCSHVFLPTFAVNPGKQLPPLRKTLSPLIGIPCLPNLRVANVVTRERGTLMLPCLSLTGVFPFFGSRTSKQRALRSNDRKSPLHRILRCQHNDLTLEIFAAQIGSFWMENRAEGTSIFAAFRSQKPNHTLPSSENLKISRQASESTGNEDRSK